jgi:hypothetical protein
MHILFLVDNFPPEVNAPATRTYEHCLEWIKAGHKVTVITCAPNFPQGKVYEGYKNKLYFKENLDNISVIRVWSYIAENKGVIKRVLDWLSFAVMSMFVGVFQKHDLIIATSPQFFTTWSAWVISKIRRKPWVFEVRDLYPESIKTVGAIKNEIIINILEKIEIGLYKNANKVIVVTDAFKKNLISRGIKESHVDVITNGSNLELFYPRKKNEKLLEHFNLEGKFIVGYIGTHGMAHGLDFILNSIQKVKDKNIHFLFIGDGSEKVELLKLAKKINLKNITFLDPISKELVPEYLSIVDISLVPLLKAENYKQVIPSKIFESSAMHKPILLGVEGQAKKIIDQYKAGLTYEPENQNDFLVKLENISDKSLYDELVVGCQNLAVNYNRKSLAKKMLKILTKI